jgi:hypothetical protein
MSYDSWKTSPPEWDDPLDDPRVTGCEACDGEGCDECGDLGYHLPDAFGWEEGDPR